MLCFGSTYARAVLADERSMDIIPQAVHHDGELGKVQNSPAILYKRINSRPNTALTRTCKQSLCPPWHLALHTAQLKHTHLCCIVFTPYHADCPQDAGNQAFDQHAGVRNCTNPCQLVLIVWVQTLTCSLQCFSRSWVLLAHLCFQLLYLTKQPAAQTPTIMNM